ncbi:glycosyltransferase family protein [Streptosporangium soli]|nr:hypothetical protein [Streptosporangium sp. KLBMP 9127]
MWQCRAASALVPIACHEVVADGVTRGVEKAVFEHPLEVPRQGGAREVFVAFSLAKWEVSRFPGAGDRHGMNLGHRCQEEAGGMPYAFDAARPFAGDQIVRTAMPETAFRPGDTIARSHRDDDANGVREQVESASTVAG